MENDQCNLECNKNTPFYSNSNKKYICRTINKSPNNYVSHWTMSNFLNFQGQFVNKNFVFEYENN